MCAACSSFPSALCSCCAVPQRPGIRLKTRRALRIHLAPGARPADQDPATARNAPSQELAQQPQGQQRDRVTLANGDVLRGELVDFLSGRITFRVDGLGDLEIDLDDLADLSTAEPVVVVTDERSHVEGRIRGIVGDQLQMSLADESFTTIPLEDWDALRFPVGAGPGGEAPCPSAPGSAPATRKSASSTPPSTSAVDRTGIASSARSTTSTTKTTTT